MKTLPVFQYKLSKILYIRQLIVTFNLHKTVFDNRLLR